MATLEDVADTAMIHWPSVVRHYRLSKGLKQAALADDLNVTQTMVSRWEAGGAIPSARIRERIFELMWSDTAALSREAWYHGIRRHPAIVCIIDANGRQVLVSRGFLRCLNAERSEVEGRFIHEAFSGDFVRLFDALRASGLFEGRVASAESVDLLEFNRPDGSTSALYVHGLHKPVFLPGQSIVWSASGAEISRFICEDVRQKLGGKMVIRRAI